MGTRTVKLERAGEKSTVDSSDLVCLMTKIPSSVVLQASAAFGHACFSARAVLL